MKKIIFIFIFLLSCNSRISKTVDTEKKLSDGLEYNEHRIFVSSLRYNGDLGGLTGADEKCDSLAKSVGLTRKYKAFLPGTGVGESLGERFEINGAIYIFSAKDIKIKVIEDDELWTSGYFDFDVGGAGMLSSIEYDENFNPPSGSEHWSGTDSTAIVDGNCSNWTNATSFLAGIVGETIALDDSWFDGDSFDCDQLHSIICLSQ